MTVCAPLDQRDWIIIKKTHNQRRRKVSRLNITVASEFVCICAFGWSNFALQNNDEITIKKRVTSKTNTQQREREKKKTQWNKSIFNAGNNSIFSLIRFPIIIIIFVSRFFLALPSNRREKTAQEWNKEKKKQRTKYRTKMVLLTRGERRFSVCIFVLAKCNLNNLVGGIKQRWLKQSSLAACH